MEIGSQLTEVAMTVTKETFWQQRDHEQEREARLTKLASSEPSLEFTVESKKILLSYQNLNECTISYFAMDISE